MKNLRVTLWGVFILWIITGNILLPHNANKQYDSSLIGAWHFRSAKDHSTNGSDKLQKVYEVQEIVFSEKGGYEKVAKIIEASGKLVGYKWVEMGEYSIESGVLRLIMVAYVKSQDELFDKKPQVKQVAYPTSIRYLYEINRDQLILTPLYSDEIRKTVYRKSTRE